MKPYGYWKDRKRRVEAVKWLVKKTGKEPSEISCKDFRSNDLTTIITEYYDDSPLKALNEAGYDLSPYEMRYKPYKFWTIKKNRIGAIKWLILKTGKKPRELTAKDFYLHHLAGLLFGQYDGSPYKAVKEAGYKISPQHMINKPHTIS